MNAIIMSIGDELVLGQTVDTNSAWISRRLAGVGARVIQHVTVADQLDAITAAIKTAVPRCDLLVISGGLGPTADDVTRQALAAAMNVDMELNPGWLAAMERFFRDRGRPMPESNRIQAMIPRGAECISNTCGTAAGIAAKLARADGQTCQVYVVPGVPAEMKAMLDLSAIPHIARASGGAVILSRMLNTFGVGESLMGQQLGQLMDRSRNPSVGTTVSSGLVSVRINSSGSSTEHARAMLDETTAACRAVLGDIVFGEDDDSLASAVGSLLTKNPDHPAQVVTAESCTGGLLAKLLTDVPGSSRYVRGGWVTYANEAKRDWLGVPVDLIEQYGAVSEQVVVAMADAARKIAGADYALSISGIAGPDGGTPEKPVGTVCIALASLEGSRASTFHFPGSRDQVRLRSALTALSMLRYQIIGREMPK
jgi:nicotinamide-nucleotide amidase